MKQLLHPLVPLSILLLLLGTCFYQTFYGRNYDSAELLLINQTTKDAQKAQNLLEGLVQINKKHLSDQHIERGSPNVEWATPVFKKADTLKSIYKKYSKQLHLDTLAYLKREIEILPKKESIALGNQYISVKGLNIQEIFQDFVREIRTVDTLLHKKYDNYQFEGGILDSLLANNFLHGKTTEVLLHTAWLKAELAQIYAQSATSILDEYGFYVLADRETDNIYLPKIEKFKEGEYVVSVLKISPFRMLGSLAKAQGFEANFNFHLDNKGFLIIDQEDFEAKDLRLRWYPAHLSDVRNEEGYLELGKKGFHYEKK